MTQKPLNKPLIGPDFLHCPGGVLLVSSTSALGEWRTNTPQFPQFASVRDLPFYVGDIFSGNMVRFALSFY